MKLINDLEKKIHVFFCNTPTNRIAHIFVSSLFYKYEQSIDFLFLCVTRTTSPLMCILCVTRTDQYINFCFGSMQIL